MSSDSSDRESLNNKQATLLFEAQLMELLFFLFASKAIINFMAGAGRRPARARKAARFKGQQKFGGNRRATGY